MKLLAAALAAAAALSAAAAGEARGAGVPATSLVEAGACLHAPDSGMVRGFDVVTTEAAHAPGDVSGGHAGLAHLNDDMTAHHAVIAKAAADAEAAFNPEATSCCNGMLCEHASGVCCPGSTHCCARGYSCTGDFPPQCVDDQVDEQPAQEAPTRVHVERVVVKHKGKVVRDSGPLTPEAALKAAEPSTQDVRDQFGAVGGGGDDDKKPGLPAGLLSDANYPAPPAGSTGEAATQEGTQWPPMLAFAPDGSARSYVEEMQRDWTGGALLRNGTHNVLRDQLACQKQCDELPECRVARYARTNGECWLDSEVASAPAPCPRVRGLMNCVSLVKRSTKRDAVAFPYPSTVGLTRGEWAVSDLRNWIPSADEVAEQGGRLTRNGKRNLVDREEDCVKQCAGIRYCAVAMYMRSTGECYLSSKVARAGVRCALRGSQRNCASYVKRRKDEVKAADQRPLDASAAGAASASGAAGGGSTVVVPGEGGDQSFNVNVEQPN